MLDETITQVTVVSGERQLQIPLLGKSAWSIGRGSDCAIIINEPWISRNQAMIQQTDLGEYFLIDLGSRNGTFVNGKRVAIPMRLQNGDLINFGQTASGNLHLIFSCPSTTQELERQKLSWLEKSATIQVNEQRLISVLVMDIRDFTRLTREMPADQLSKMIGTWFGEAGQIIQQHGSNVDKYIGDAVMAVWLHPGLDPEGSDVLQILKALYHLWKMTQSLQARFTVPFPLCVGAGVNTGYAMVGNKGTSDRPDYSPLGDTVNAAFRLESCTKELKQDIAIGSTTYEWLCSALPECSQLFKAHQVMLKGYDQATSAYSCLFSELEQFLNTHHQLAE